MKKELYAIMFERTSNGGIERAHVFTYEVCFAYAYETAMRIIDDILPDGEIISIKRKDL